LTQSLQVKDLYVSYGDVDVLHGISFSVARGEMVTLLGSSGCGKSTTLRTVAGLETARAGEIIIEDKVVFSSLKGIHVPTEKRGLSMVFQSYAIWPHMTVFENVAYGLRIKGHKNEKLNELVDQALRMVHLERFSNRQATMLSGGQQQRVALARSIAFNPKIILFDEPLSNLDAKLRREMREQIRELQLELGFSGVYVTHDQEEALAISDRIIAMNEGHIDQDAHPESIYEQPKTKFVADFIGSSILVKGKVIDQVGNHLVFETEQKDLIHCSNVNEYPPEAVQWVAIKPGHIELSGQEPVFTANKWKGKIIRKTFLGDHYELKMEWGANTLNIPRNNRELNLQESEIYISADPSKCIPLIS
jgi:iron(III) transport system ATP-binding protein